MKTLTLSPSHPLAPAHSRTHPVTGHHFPRQSRQSPLTSALLSHPLPPTAPVSQHLPVTLPLRPPPLAHPTPAASRLASLRLGPLPVPYLTENSRRLTVGRCQRRSTTRQTCSDTAVGAHSAVGVICLSLNVSIVSKRKHLPVGGSTDLGEVAVLLVTSQRATFQEQVFQHEFIKLSKKEKGGQRM